MVKRPGKRPSSLSADEYDDRVDNDGEENDGDDKAYDGDDDDGVTVAMTTGRRRVVMVGNWVTVKVMMVPTVVMVVMTVMICCWCCWGMVMMTS